MYKFYSFESYPFSSLFDSRSRCKWKRNSSHTEVWILVLDFLPSLSLEHMYHCLFSHSDRVRGDNYGKVHIWNSVRSLCTQWHSQNRNKHKQSLIIAGVVVEICTLNQSVCIECAVQNTKPEWNEALHKSPEAIRSRVLVFSENISAKIMAKDE